MYRTVKNKCLNHLKHQNIKNLKLRSHLVEDYNNDTFEANLIKEEMIKLFYQAIGNLPDNCKNIIELAIGGLKNEEIANKLNISVNTVKTHKKSAYKLLRIKLKDILPSAILLFEIIIT